MLRHIWRGVRQLLGGGETVFHSFLFGCLVSLQNILGTVGVRLKLEVFWNSKLLKIGSIFKAKVRVRLKLECGLN